jgi:magnesium-dependent phosphatase-1
MSSPSASDPQLKALLGGGKKPSLVVFDADYTLWPFDCERGVVAPFHEKPSHPRGPYDRYGRLAAPYPAVPHVVTALVDTDTPIAVASRNPAAGPISELLRAISISPTTRPEVTNLWEAMPSPLYFHAYSSGGYGKGKDRHFVTLRALTETPFTDMLFFDDVAENIIAAKEMGITAVQVAGTGVTFDSFRQGVTEWREKS